MEKGEYWLLDSAVELRYPLSLLVHPQIEDHFNRKSHGLTYSELTALLYRLFQDGVLEAMLIQNYKIVKTFIPTSVEIEAGLRGETEIIYGLTIKGGTVWEEASNPNWNEYINYIGDIDNGEIITATPELAKLFLAWVYHTVPDFILQKEEWAILRPWYATYWKTLPVGYKVQFWYTSNELSPTSAIDFPPDLQKRLAGYSDYWYRKYSS